MSSHIKTSHGMAILGACFLVAIILIGQFSKQLNLVSLSIPPHTQLAQVSCATGDLTCGLVGWWKFDEGSGTTAGDSSGQGNTGTLLGSTLPGWVSGKIGTGALNFNGTSSYVNAGSNSSLNFGTGSFSIAFWMNASALPSDYGGLITKMAPDYSTGWYTAFYSSGKIGIYVRASVNNYGNLTSSSVISPNQWHQIVAIIDQSAALIHLYVDGQEAGTPMSISGWGPVDAVTPLLMGANRADLEFFPGSLDDVRVYNRALSASEVQALYTNTGTTIVSQPASLSPAPTTYTITPSSVINGTINPSSATTVTSGGSQKFTITPNYGYQIGSVTVDGSSVGTVTSYTFNDVTANHTISANFTQIVTTPPASGSISSNIYISQSGGGSGASCASPLSVSWFNTAGSWGTGTNQIGPGDTVHLCENITTNLVAQGSGTSGNPITILFEPGATMSKPAWSGDIIQVDRLSYITIDGGATGRIGGYTGNPLLANGIIESTDNGTNLGSQSNSVGVSGKESNHIIVKNLVIRNLYVHVQGLDDGSGDAVRAYWYGGSSGPSDWLVDNCIFHDMFVGFTIGYGPGSQNFTYSNSTAYNVNWGGNAGDDGSLTSLTNLVVSGDYFHDWVNWDQTNDDNHHNGFYAWAEIGGTINSVTYSGNTLGTNNSSGTNYQTSDLFVSGAGVTGTVNIYNNTFVDTGLTSGPSNGLLFVWPGHGSVTRVYNNTFISNKGAVAIGIQGNNGGTETFDIKNNIATDVTFIYVESNASVSLNSSNNIGYNLATDEYNTQPPNAAFVWSSTNSGAFYTLTGWKAVGQALGHDFDNNMSTSSPNLNGSYVPQTGSPAIGAGINLSSYFTTDATGITRPSTGPWDIGAYQYSSGGTTPPPTPISGSCSTTVNQCTAGTFSDVADTSSNHLWSCTGSNGGTTASCSLPIPSQISGSCSTTLNQCTVGTFSDVTDTSSNHLWSCTGSNGGTTSSCSIPIVSTSTPVSTPTPSSGSTPSGGGNSGATGSGGGGGSSGGGGGSSYIPTTPAISNITTTPVGATSMTISWSTSLPTSSQILYGLTSIYGSQTSLVSTLTTAHSVTLTNLQSNTIYHFKILSTVSGNTAPASDMTFTTGKASIYTTTPTSAPTTTNCPPGLTCTPISVSSSNPALTKFLSIGSSNSQVLDLQKILSSLGYLTVTPTGYYGSLTQVAVEAFQKANGIPTVGTVGPLTRAVLNKYITTTSAPITQSTASTVHIVQPQVSTPSVTDTFTTTLKLGSTGTEVQQLQRFLNTHGFIVATSGNGSPGHETTYYGLATASAISRFQMAHALQILTPNGLTQGTGNFGPATMKVVNGMN